MAVDIRQQQDLLKKFPGSHVRDAAGLSAGSLFLRAATKKPESSVRHESALPSTAT